MHCRAESDISIKEALYHKRVHVMGNNVDLSSTALRVLFTDISGSSVLKENIRYTIIPPTTTQRALIWQEGG
ncbi:hypothetical protein TNCV_1194791 [Trichonephila clavipes]|nr:hypothetical protein TNCV_1194791 [Trichonephila clavipes]